MAAVRTLTRPERTVFHAQRDALLRAFADAGLTPLISTNGGVPSADVQVGKMPARGDLFGAWLTERGRSRLRAVGVEMP